MPTTTGKRLAPWLKAALPALVVAVAIGAVAAYVRTDASDAVTFTVFAAVTFPFALALGALLLDPTEPPEHHEDSIEQQWMVQASSGAFFDTVTAMGLTVFATSVLDTRGAPLWLFLLLALGDLSVRLVVLQRRDS